MTAFGKANYDAYREFSHGASMVTGDPIPQWDKLPVHIQSAWDAGADGVALVLAECPVDEDAPGSEPPKVIIVTEASGRERRFTADGFDGDTSGLDVRRDDRVIATYPGEHSWLSAREDGATVPDATVRALAVAKGALEAVAQISDPNVAVKLAMDALDEIYAETE